MALGKCKNCGSSEIDVDPARGDSVCTNCGSVLESSAIVSEVQFEDTAHGGSSAIGQFVSADSRGGARGFGGSFNYGLGQESREITLQNARKAISNLGQQLRLNQHCIDTAFNFYKLALNRNLTRGRKNTLVVAACVYMTCRTEGTAHLLIDCSDVLQINVYELGRTYLKLSQALCITIPSIDPCLYILRFASRLEFGERTHEVSMTALRLVQRMKKDSIHSGRRPSGLCGAALLMAARLHDFSRSVEDVIKVVKVHHSTLRKRLLEFGETPSSCLTLDEFMTVDLEEEQDPPSFKAARIKDRERLQKLLSDDATPSQFSDIQKEIDKVLDCSKPHKKSTKSFSEALPLVIRVEDNLVAVEDLDAARFAEASTVDIINKFCDPEPGTDEESEVDQPCGLGPNIASFNLGSSISSSLETRDADCISESLVEENGGELQFADIDDAEIDSYILSVPEINKKGVLWKTINAEYLNAQKIRDEKMEKDKEEGKPDKKRKRAGSRKNKNLSASTAGEAFSKMLKEKRLSNKINYDVLKDLSKDFGCEPMEVNPPSPNIITPTAISKPRKPAVRGVRAKVARKVQLNHVPERDQASKQVPEAEQVIKVIQEEPKQSDKLNQDREMESEYDEDDNENHLSEIEELEDTEEMDNAKIDTNQFCLTRLLNHHNDSTNNFEDDGYGDECEFEDEY